MRHGPGQRVSHGDAGTKRNVTAVQPAQPFDRRQLFRRAGALAATAGPAILLGACDRGETVPPASTPTTKASTAGGPPDWSALTRSLRGERRAAE